MEPLLTITAPAAPLDPPNVNTDQIFPARFIRKPRGPGYAGYTFHDLRFDENGNERPEFVLNREPFRNARILVGNTNFGCGSSREGAVYTLLDSGFRVLIAPSFGDIFAANCLKNGVLTIQLPGDTVAALRDEVRTARPPVMTVDLAAQRITRPNGGTLAFEIEPFHKQCLLEGLDEIDLALQHGDALADFDRRYRERFPWLFAAKAELRRR